MKTNVGQPNFLLGKKDCALVLREDGTDELYLPDKNDEEYLTDAEMKLSLLMRILADKKLYQQLMNQFLKEMGYDQEAS